MDLQLAGQVALVTGSGRGIGLAIARALGAEGCSVAINARSPDSLKTASDQVGAKCSQHVADLSDPGAAGLLVESVVERWGRLDVLVCNVGSGASVSPGEETGSEWRRVLDLNLFAATEAIAAARPVMQRSSGAKSIVCISSICGMAALGAPVTYSAAKAALNATVRGLARPLAAENIRINAVAPGNILAAGGVWERKQREAPEAVHDMLSRDVALKRLGTPQEVADLTVFLASPRASFITGSIVVVDGGQLRC